VLPRGREPAGRAPATVVARLVGRRAAREGTLWGFAFGTVVVASLLGYVNSYPRPADRLVLKTALASNAGIQALLGPPRRIDTVAGFTAWRAVGVVTLIGAVWGLLAGTRFLRGEEEAGRWEILLSGQTTRGRAAAQALAGLGAGVGALFVTTALIVLVLARTPDAGFSVSSSLYLSVALVASASMFVAVGALASQLAATRRRAASIAAAFFGVSFVVRLVANAGSGGAWIRWLSPLGWIDELHPLTGSRPVALVPIVGFIAALAAATVTLAARRDLGGSALPDHDTAPARMALLNGPGGLAVRIVRPVALGWVVGIAALGLLLGLVARSAAQAIAGSSAIAQALARLGGHRGGAQLYLGFSFLIVATLVGLVAASQVAATREEEADGHLDNLLVRPVRRSTWLAGRVGVTAVVVVASGVAAGLAAFLGAATQHSGVGLVRMLDAGVNVVPPAIFVLGVGTLVHGVQPRLTAVVAYGLVAWSFLVELVGAFVNASHWLLDTSVLHHIKPVPAADPDWTAALVLVALGLVAGLLGGVVLERRDLSGA